MCTRYLACDKSGKDAIYEFITNAMDARKDCFPSVQFGSDSVIIEDEGNGLNCPKSFFYGSLPSYDRHGRFGLGLKEAIAICIRTNWILNIQSAGTSYSFEETRNSDGSYGPIMVHADRNANTVEGTIVKISSPRSDFTEIEGEVTSKFLFLMNPTQVNSLNGSIEVYKTDEYEGGLYLRGVRKEIHEELKWIYDFVNPTEGQKKSFDQDHKIKPNKFKAFRSLIMACNPEEFKDYVKPVSGKTVVNYVHTPVYVNVPRIVAVPVNTPARESLPLKQGQDPHLVALTREVSKNFAVVDYFVWTLMPSEREECARKRGEVQEHLRQIGLSVAETQEQGSFKKNTVVPGFVDGDIVVKINNFSPEIHSKKIEELLEEKGFTFFESCNEIKICNYDGMDFDLVLRDATKPSRFSDAGENIVSVVGRLGNDRDRICSMMRAAKYWVKRQKNFPVKSFVVEQILVLMYEELNLSFKAFLQFFCANKWNSLPKSCREATNEEERKVLFVESTNALDYL